MPLSLQSRARVQDFVALDSGNKARLDGMLAAVRADKPGAAADLAKAVGISQLDARELAISGIEELVGDARVRGHLEATRRRSFVASEGGLGAGGTLRAKGVHQGPVGAALAKVADNDIGALLSLGSIALPQLTAKVLDRGQFELEAPLRPGSWSIPLDASHHLDFKVEAGTTVKLSMDMVPGRGGPVVSKARVQLSKDLRLANPAELAGFGGLIGGVADAMVDVKLRGVEIGADGRMQLDGTVQRPSLNPLKHLLASGTSTDRLDSWLSQSFMPKVNTDAGRLIKGQLLDRSQGGHLVSGGVPDQLDLAAVLKGMGTIVERGHFDLSLEGRTGFVEVGGGEIKLRGKSSPLQVQLSGDFAVSDHGLSGQLKGAFDSGAVDGEFELEGEARRVDGGVEGSLRAKARVTPDRNQTLPGDGTLPVDIQLTEEAVGARIGAVAVEHDDKRVRLSAGKTVLDVVHDLERQTSVRLGEQVHVDLDGEMLASADASFRWDARGVHMNADRVNVDIDVGERTQMKSDRMGLRLGPDSRISMRATDVAIDDGQLVIGNSETGFEAHIAAGHVKRGPVTTQIEQGKTSTVAGTIELGSTDGHHEGVSDISVDVVARPKAFGWRLPVGAKIKGGAHVEISGRKVTIERHVDKVSPFSR